MPRASDIPKGKVALNALIAKKEKAWLKKKAKAQSINITTFIRNMIRAAMEADS
jgi:hypothetical protein